MASKLSKEEIMVPLLGPVGQLADALTTAAVLSRGGREMNPLMKDPAENLPVFFLIKAGIGVAQHAIVRALYRSGRRKLARVVGTVNLSFGALPAVHNVGVLKRMGGL